MIEHIPSWASAPFQSYLASGRVHGADRQELSPQEASERIAICEERFEKSRSTDETTADYRRDVTGVVLTQGPLGAELTHYQERGGHRELAREVVGAPVAIYSHDDGRVLKEMILTRVEGMESLTISHVDRQDPSRCYLLHRGV